MVSVEVSMIDLEEWKRAVSNYVSVIDTIDVVISYTKRQEVYDWCSEHNIEIEYQGTMMGTDVWRVKDEKQRLWFKLRWQ
jgi:hypothetical protein